MGSPNSTTTLSNGISVSDITSRVQSENDEIVERTVSDGAGRFDLMSKPFWLRLVVALGFVLAALLTNLLLSFAVERPISSPLFLVAIGCSAWLCGFRIGVLATVASGFLIDFFFVVPILQYYASRDEVVRLLIFLGEGGIISWVVEMARIANNARDRSNEQLRALADRQQTVRESEQKRIALEIHDELGQALTGLKMAVHLLRRDVDTNGDEMPADNMSKKLKELSSIIDATIGTVRRIATELRPSILDDFGLIAAMEWQAQEYERKTGIPGIFRSDTDHLDLCPHAQIAVFRIFQEALTNIARHSKATHFTVDIESNADPIVITIRDDGVGFEPGTLSQIHSLGIVGMKERANLSGAEFSIYNRHSGGVGIELKIPRTIQLSNNNHGLETTEK